MTAARIEDVTALAQAFGRDIGEIAPNVRKNAFDMPRAPLPSDDETMGYAVGSRWVSGRDEWVRLDDGTNGAQWFLARDVPQSVIDQAAQEAASSAATAVAPAAADAIRSQVEAAADRAEEAAGAIGPIASSVAIASTLTLDQKLDSGNVPYAATAIDGGWHLPGLRGRSVQDWIRNLRETLTTVPAKIQRLSAPALMRIETAERAVMGLQDQAGGLHLPGLGGLSVQDHVHRANQRMAALTKALATAGRTYVVDAVVDLGCDPNGVEPIHGKINGAIAKLKARATLSGNLATIYFPEGRYNLTDRIYPDSRISFVGAGTGRTVFAPSYTWSAFEKLNPRGTYLEHCVFANFTIDASGQILASSGNYKVRTKGLFIQGFRNCLFTDLELLDTGATGLGIDFADRSVIQRVKVERGGRLAAVGNPGASGIGIGTGWLSSEPLIIADCTTIGCRNYGVFVERQNAAADYFDAQHTLVHGLISKENNYGFGEEGCNGTVLSAAQLTGNLSSGIVQHHGTFGNAPHPGQRLIVRGCDISFNTGHGWSFNGTKNFGPRGFSSDGNRIEGNTGNGYNINGGSGTVDDFRIGNDEVIGNGGQGLLAQRGTLTNFDVTGTRFLRNTGAAIQLDAAITGGRIFGATIRDLQAVPTQTQSIVGSGALTDFDISETHGVGCSAINLTGAQTRVTYGRNPGV